ncbi:MAG TPA: Crp/Fnr family transcriptional regulator [Puia sp.]|jgi:CRP-like cAMP-binding protein|nr:Crp/Fnr family transcriptional regulator [Puia sp.]
MEDLIFFLNSIHPLSDGLRNYLAQTIQAKTIKKRDYLLKAGRVCDQIYFIEKGLLRCFYLKNLSEVCSWFMKEGDVAISIESFFLQKPSYESIQAVEETALHYISYKDLQYIYNQFPEFNFIGRVLTEKYYSQSEQRLYAIRMQRADERYGYLMQNLPELIKRVPSSYIASYLGITLETLSRIKSKR